ncbi:TPA: hypothetical protein H1012_02835 [archaeon]|nr:hypothetical protein [Candidatus Naiadarchaeales archaeon SRR2090153.bin461]HIK02757.1 hypothetical protein [Candidatus Naiadarchaeales archaeon SRR2090159.bin1288]
MERPHGDHKLIITVIILVSIAVFLTASTTLLDWIKSKPGQQPAENPPIGLPPGVNITEEEQNAIPPIAKTIFTKPKTPEEIAESTYQEHSYYFNKNFTTVFFETHLIRVGFFRTFDETLNETRDVFRADYSVKNIQREPHIFYPSEGKVWYNLDNFSATDWNFSSISVEQGEERHAYALYGTVPRSISGPVVITVGTTRAYSPIFSEIIVVPYGFNVTLPLLARPRSALG